MTLRRRGRTYANSRATVESSMPEIKAEMALRAATLTRISVS